MSHGNVIEEHGVTMARKGERVDAVEIEISAKTDKGRRRRRNEDRALARVAQGTGPTVCLLAVADGVGGGPAGDKASDIAVTVLSECAIDSAMPPDEVLRSAFEAANRRIAEEATAKPACRGMATTLVAALILDVRLWVANVGDSRAYLLRNGFLRPLTIDHSLVAERMRAGMLSTDEAASSPYRNVVTRTVGTANQVEADIFDCGVLAPKDVVLLCSDGLYNMVSDSDIADCVEPKRPKDAVKELIRLANRRGGQDNIAVALARINAAAAQATESADAG